MALTVQQSLFEAGGGAPLAESARWIEGVMLGDIALGVCVIAVAFIGALMLSGRLRLHEGARVVVGSFVLLGASLVATGLLEIIISPAATHYVDLQISEQTLLRTELPRASYNPYAQASVQSDR